MATTTSKMDLARTAGELALPMALATAACGPRLSAESQCRSDVDCEAGSCVNGTCEGGGYGQNSGLRDLASLNAVDILVVVDDGPSMARAQAKLAQSLEVLVARLEGHDLPVNYRIGFTTTDVGHFACTGSSPARGALRAAPCALRPQDFSLAGADPADDPLGTACLDVCPLKLAQAYAPTAVDAGLDPQPAVRPWLERRDDRYNFEGVSMAEALACLAPQGIDGCDFGAPLEASYQAIARQQDQDDPNHGFFRERSVKALLVLTDEVDCATTDDLAQQVFDPMLPVEDRVFWSDPERNAPSPAICWNAGVACEPLVDDETGEPVDDGTYAACKSQDHAVDGAPLEEGPADAAVIRPVERYVNLLQAVQDDGQSLAPDNELIFQAIVGVPEGYADGVPLVLRDPTDPEVAGEFGIDFGCMGMDGSAGMPPVRIREVSAAFDMDDDVSADGDLYSICQDDYGAAMAAFAERILGEVQPDCYERCAMDVDPSTPETTDADCTVEQWDELARAYTNVVPCDGHELPEGADLCFYTRTGTSLNPGGERMSAVCEANGWNVEFVIVRKPGVFVHPWSRLRGRCEASNEPNADCPNLGS